MDGGTRTHLSVAIRAVSPGTWSYWDLQSVVFRGRVGRKGPSRPDRPAVASPKGSEEVLEATVRGHQRLRETPGSQRHDRVEVLPERVEERAEETVPGTARQAGEELE